MKSTDLFLQIVRSEGDPDKMPGFDVLSRHDRAMSKALREVIEERKDDFEALLAVKVDARTGAINAMRKPSASPVLVQEIEAFRPELVFGVSEEDSNDVISYFRGKGDIVADSCLGLEIAMWFDVDPPGETLIKAMWLGAMAYIFQERDVWSIWLKSNRKERLFREGLHTDEPAST